MIPEYINLFVGHSNNPNHRHLGSSGGIGTELLAELLNAGKVDAVIGVGFEQNDKTKPIYKIVDKANNIVQLSGSKYTYMESAPLIELLKQNTDKILAVVVQPCFVPLMRSQFKNVLYIISFFCGYNNTYEATEYLLKKAKTEKEKVESMNYRGGEYPGGFWVKNIDGSQRQFGKEHYELINLLFLRTGCGRCRIYISDSADIVIGDAWIKNAKKETTILINTKAGDDIIRDMRQQKIITLYDLEREELYEMHKHNIKYKQGGHSFFMKIIVALLNNKISRKIAPLYFFGYLSRIRRSFILGINKQLIESVKYNTK